MEIKLTEQESEEYFYNSLCNGLDYLSGYGLDLEVEDSIYDKAKQSFLSKNPNNSPCYEDILMEVLRNGDEITLIDVEGDGEYTKSITLKDVHDRVSKTPNRHLFDMINEEDDAQTADIILQSVFFEDIVFG